MIRQMKQCSERVLYTCTLQVKSLVAPVVQLVTSKLSDVGT